MRRLRRSAAERAGRRRHTSGVTRVAAVAAVLTLVGTPATVLADEVELVSGEELLANSADYDQAAVTVEGELVGDYGFRDDGFMWTQLNDDSYARRALVDGGARTGPNVGIGVRMPAELSRGLDPVGGYRLEGPLVQLRGVWRHHDPGRGGESYLDVSAMVIVETGRRLQEGPDWAVFAGGVLLTAGALQMWWRRRRLEADLE